MKVSGLFSDNLILQRDKENIIYGTAESLEQIEVCVIPESGDEGLHKATISCTADEEGNWECTIPIFEAGGPYKIKVTPGDFEINNVMFGDVFLLGGQSNMELTIGMIPDENERVLRTANNDNIRMFMVPQEYDFSGKPRLLERNPWVSVNKDTVVDFSAIGYFFANEKYKRDSVPVGLIHTAVGGAPIEALMSEKNILECAKVIKNKLNINGDCNHGKMNGGSPVVAAENSIEGTYNLEHDKHRGCIYCYEELIEKTSDLSYSKNVDKEDNIRVEKWHKDIDDRDPGLAEEWYLTKFSDEAESNQGIEKIEMPRFFNNTKYLDYFGTLWLQKEFYVSEKHAGYEAKLYLGTLVDFDTAYVNGVMVGSTDYRYPQRRYVVPKGVIKPGKNTVTVRLGMDGNVGGFLPDMPYKISMEVDICRGGCSSNCSSCGGECNNIDGCRNANSEVLDIKLTGEWYIREGARAERLEGLTFFIWHPTALYNSMIAPLRGLSVSAILFYQGESNGFAPEYYGELFKAMVNEWRGLVGDVPVLYSEVAVYLGDGPEYDSDSFAGVREAQRSVEPEIDGAFLIPITQLPAPYNELHPQNKLAVARLFYDIYVKNC